MTSTYVDKLQGCIKIKQFLFLPLLDSNLNPRQSNPGVQNTLWLHFQLWSKHHSHYIGAKRIIVRPSPWLVFYRALLQLWFLSHLPCPWCVQRISSPTSLAGQSVVTTLSLFLGPRGRQAIERNFLCFFYTKTCTWALIAHLPKKASSTLWLRCKEYCNYLDE